MVLNFVLKKKKKRHNPIFLPRKIKLVCTLSELNFDLFIVTLADKLLLDFVQTMKVCLKEDKLYITTILETLINFCLNLVIHFPSTTK